MFFLAPFWRRSSAASEHTYYSLYFWPNVAELVLGMHDVRRYFNGPKKYYVVRFCQQFFLFCYLPVAVVGLMHSTYQHPILDVGE